MKNKRFFRKDIVLSCVLLAVILCSAVVLGTASGKRDGINNATPNNIANDNSDVYIPKTVAGNPVVTLYSFDDNNDIGNEDYVKRHFVSQLNPEAETGWTRLSETIFIDVAIPDNTVMVQTYYAEAGTEAVAYRMLDSKYSDPYINSSDYEKDSHPLGNTWTVTDYFPSGFLGHIWAVTIDAEGTEHTSDIINAIYEPETVSSPNTDQIAGMPENALLDQPTTSEQGTNSVSCIENGFAMKLFSDKEVYSTTEIIKIWATLEYIGNDDAITIWHGDPYMVFSITNGKDFNFGGFVYDVLMSTVLEKAKVYSFAYIKSGAWNADDPNASFWENFYKEKDLLLPAGEYTITLRGGFSLTEQTVDSRSGLLCELKIKVEQ